MCLLGLSVFYLVATAQELYNKQAIYTMTFQTDSNDIETKNTVEMELLINDSNSLFQTLKQRQQDSVLYFHEQDKANRSSIGGGIIAKPINKLSYKIIKDNNSIKVYDSAFGLNLDGKDIIYSYQEPIDSFYWQIKEDTIHYGNWICQRADLQYGGRIWTAWFALDIPIFEGPYKFSGLPGLIVKIADKKKYWTFALTSLKELSIQHAINFQGWYIFEEKNKEELYRDRRDFQQSLTVLAADAKPENSAYAEKSKELKERLKVLLEKDNNWIELYP